MEERGDVVLSREAIYTGFKKARQPGRLEVLSLRDEGKKEPLVLIDGAHNEDGARVLQEAVSQLVTGSRILMVTGILADKDVEKVLERFLGITGDFIATEPDNPRKLAATALAQRIEEMGGSCIPEPDLEKACQLALEKAEDYDGIVFAGSLYMIGAARSILRKKLGKA
jgi:dihydrofolate synthase/folylpolyglutamate synthase